jgi:Spy/CpxP family protein refolding chaperone
MTTDTLQQQIIERLDLTVAQRQALNDMYDSIILEWIAAQKQRWEAEARIDELRDVQEYYVADYIDTTAGKNIDNYIESRLTELKGSKK